MVIRSRDIIHSAYIPHLRAQMNAVPGMTTTFKMVPTITTDSMRTAVVMDDTFDYVLLCNKICGASHYNMQMPLVVEPTSDYNAWLAQQKGFEMASTPAAPVEATTTTAVLEAATTAPNTH